MATYFFQSPSVSSRSDKYYKTILLEVTGIFSEYL